MITLLALPTIWFVNRDDDGPSSSRRPNVAVVGIDPGDAEAGASSQAAQASSFDPMGESGAMYLEPGTTLVPPDSVVLVIGSSPDQAVATARGSYRRSVPSSTCMFNGLPGGEHVTVVNVANGRSIECTTAPYDGARADVLMMNTVKFQLIADLTAAPIHVEVRQ